MTRLRLAAIAAPAVLLAACVIDLGGLTGGPPGSGGASTGGASSGGAGGAGGGVTPTGSDAGEGDAGAGVLGCDPCPDGGCVVEQISTNQPTALALTGEGLYWTNGGDGTIVRLPADGSPAVVLSTANAPVAIAVAGGYAVWAAQDGVYGCSVAGCAASQIKITGAAATGSIQGVAYDGQDVFFTEQGDGTSTGGSVVRCPAQAGCPARLTLGSGYYAPLGVALYDTQVFWTNQGDGQENGSILHSPKSDAGALSITASINLPTGLAADGADAYWTEAVATGGKVRRCPYTGGYCQTPEDLATGLAAPLGLALGGGRVYWADSGDGLVLSCPVAGCGGGQPTVHATGRTGARAVALGATCLFWIDEAGGGTIAKVGR